jgi:hypothetical protein
VPKRIQIYPRPLQGSPIMRRVAAATRDGAVFRAPRLLLCLCSSPFEAAARCRAASERSLAACAAAGREEGEPTPSARTPAAASSLHEEMRGRRRAATRGPPQSLRACVVCVQGTRRAPLPRWPACGALLVWPCGCSRGAGPGRVFYGS